MPYFMFFWTDENLEHCTAHGVSAEDFEAIVQHPMRTEESDSSDRTCAFGLTEDGRKAVCVYEMLDSTTVYPVTAFFAGDE